MSFLRKVVGVLNTEITVGGRSSTRSETEGDTSVTAGPLDGEDGQRLLTLESYETSGIAAGRQHTFELRYAAYGEKSNMTCETLYACRGGAKGQGIDNALSMAIDLDGKSVASLLLVLDSREGLAADDEFVAETAQLRKLHGPRLCEISHFTLSREHKSRRALGAMFHVLSLYARQARQMHVLLVQTHPGSAHLIEKLLGFRTIGVRRDRVLMVLELDTVKREQRQWGGQKEAAQNPPYLLYPFFFTAKDEPGLLFRLLDHLGRSSLPSS